MLDVLIVADLVVVGKFRGLAEVEVHYGLYVFATAVILIHMATCRLETLTQRVTHPTVRVADKTTMR